MTGSRWFRCIDSIEDGSGSRSHEFLQARAKFFTSSSVSSANSDLQGDSIIRFLGSIGRGLSAGRQLGSYCSDLKNKVVPHIVGELNSIV